MVKRLLISFGLIALGLTFAGPVFAICPVCTVAVGAGVGLCRWLGIDDTISGVWIGGLIVSLIVWFLGWLDKKQILFRFRGPIASFVFYLLVIGPLFFSGIIGHPLNTFYGVDKLLFGISLGSIVFLGTILLHNFLKKKNNGKSFFSYQKVVLPILSLVFTSLVLYFIFGCK